ncbi:MAG: helix-turn-helix transcriptional regulator [Halopenitus sp.]
MRERIDPQILGTIARRTSLLHRIRDGCRDKRELEQSLDISRSTLDRAVRRLSDEGVVRYQNGKCTVTLFGQLALEEYEQLNTRYEALDKSKPLLQVLNPDIPLDPQVFDGAHIVLSEKPAPHAPINGLEDHLEQCHSIIGFSPVVLPRYVEIFYEHAVERDVEIELILNCDLVKYLWTAYPSKLQDVLEQENTTVCRIDETTKIGIVVVDNEQVWIGVYDDGGLEGAIINDNEFTLEWATDMLHTYRSQAEKVFLRGRSSVV